jgi:hypothetical protein
MMLVRMFDNMNASFDFPDIPDIHDRGYGWIVVGPRPPWLEEYTEYIKEKIVSVCKKAMSREKEKMEKAMDDMKITMEKENLGALVEFAKYLDIDNSKVRWEKELVEWYDRQAKRNMERMRKKNGGTEEKDKGEARSEMSEFSEDSDLSDASEESGKSDASG